MNIIHIWCYDATLLRPGLDSFVHLMHCSCLMLQSNERKNSPHSIDSFAVHYDHAPCSFCLVLSLFLSLHSQTRSHDTFIGVTILCSCSYVCMAAGRIVIVCRAVLFTAPKVNRSKFCNEYILTYSVLTWLEKYISFSVLHMSAAQV